VFSIGALAEAVGVSSPTIRYYEEIKLISRARRRAAGHRHSARADVNRLAFIGAAAIVGSALNRSGTCQLVGQPGSGLCRGPQNRAWAQETVRQKLANR